MSSSIDDGDDGYDGDDGRCHSVSVRHIHEDLAFSGCGALQVTVARSGTLARRPDPVVLATSKMRRALALPGIELSALIGVLCF